jgi:PAS domain S-box-containing protein
MTDALPPLDQRALPMAVLLLEDSRFDAELLGEFLRHAYPLATLEVVSDEPGFQAALAARRFDVILSDYELPGFSGAQALQQALQAAPRTPFIFVSGVIGEDNAVEMLKRGATDYVSKGRLARLTVVIDRALREVAERGARDRAESQLREADATHAHVLDSLRDYAVIQLDRQGRIRSWNRAAREIFGHESDAVLDAPAALLFTPEDCAAGVPQAELQDALRDGKANRDRWMMRSDGTRLWAEGVVTPLHTGGGAPAGFCKIVHDATAAYEAAAALRAAKEEAEHANLAKNRFLAVLSHELRTPLTPIASATHVLERYAAVPAKYRGLLAMIQRNVALEARLIDDLLDLTAISAGKVVLKRAPVDMHHLVQRVLEMVAETIRDKRLHVRLELAAPIAVVEADEARMQQVLWNIMRNAVKFTPEAGHILIRSDCDDAHFTLSCSDNGIGIDAAALPRIFTAFEQADGEVFRRFGGLGLGLAIARGLVAEHAGQLTAHSDGRGRGATFTLQLPCLAAAGLAPQAADALAAAPPALPSHQTCRLLLVEDNMDTADALALSLEGFGYSVTLAMTVAEALAAARKAHFDVAVTDIGLPDGSGIELGRHLRGSVPVIALSGYGSAQDVERSELAGFRGHLIKPADPAAVHSMVQKVLAQPH